MSTQLTWTRREESDWRTEQLRYEEGVRKPSREGGNHNHDWLHLVSWHGAAASCKIESIAMSGWIQLIPVAVTRSLPPPPCLLSLDCCRVQWEWTVDHWVKETHKQRHWQRIPVNGFYVAHNFNSDIEWY